MQKVSGHININNKKRDYELRDWTIRKYRIEGISKIEKLLHVSSEVGWCKDTIHYIFYYYCREQVIRSISCIDS
jgi:hypothetical protein